MHLSKPVLKELIQSQQIITDFADLEGQLTANGFDVRLAAVVEVLDGGKLAVEKANHRQPKLGKAFVLKGYEGRLEGVEVRETIVSSCKPIKLEKLKPYLVITCEKINVPKSMMTHITPRTSLFRLTQSVLGCGFGEAGYQGFLTFMMLSFLDSEIELGARFAHLSFSELKGESSYEDQREKSYQGGKLI